MKNVNFRKIDWEKYKYVLISAALFILLLVVDFIHCGEIEALKAKIETLSKPQPVYVYDVRKIVANHGELIALQEKYSKQLAELNKQLADAQKKLANMKDRKARAEYSDIYLSALTLKRDNLMEDYDKAINEISAKTDAALLKVVKDKGGNVVYDIKSIAVTSPNVIDITGEVLQTIQQQ